MEQQHHLRLSILTLIGGFLILVIKFLAWWWTNSNAILTDALESIINIVAGVFALYSLSLSLRPRDENHPNGHGKIEFISAGFEGALILIAGLLIIVKSITALFAPHEVSSLSLGIWVTVGSGFANYIMGYFLEKKGKAIRSFTLEANGKHLKSDAYSSLGLIVGLALVMFSGIDMLDNVVAIIFGLIIIATGYKLVRESVGGIMDEADTALIEELVLKLGENREEDWIDIHNTRIIKYGSHLHMDCHLTLPWFYTNLESHDCMKRFEETVESLSEHPIELFVHVDPCRSLACQICEKKNCPQRLEPCKGRMTWTLENATEDMNHGLLAQRGGQVVS